MDRTHLGRDHLISFRSTGVPACGGSTKFRSTNFFQLITGQQTSCDVIDWKKYKWSKIRRTLVCRCYWRNLDGLGFSYMSFVAAVITLVLNINNNINANNNNLNRINLNYGSSKNTLTSLNQNVGNNFNIMLPPGKKKKRKRRRRKKRSINIENLEDLLLELSLLATKYV